MELLYDLYTSQDGVRTLLKEAKIMSDYNLSESEWEEVGDLAKNVATYNRTVVRQFEAKNTVDFLKKYLN